MEQVLKKNVRVESGCNPTCANATQYLHFIIAQYTISTQYLHYIYLRDIYTKFTQYLQIIYCSLVVTLIMLNQSLMPSCLLSSTLPSRAWVRAMVR